MKSTIALTILGAICSSIIPKIIDKLLLKKEWKIYQNIGWVKRIYIHGKPLIDFVVSIVLFMIVATIANLMQANWMLSMIINVIVIVLCEMIMFLTVDTKSYIYKRIRTNIIRTAIDIISYIPAIIINIIMWLSYMGMSEVSRIFVYIFFVSCFSYLTYLEPINKKANKYVDIFTDTRKSYLNVECENISQKGQWYYIKEGDVTRKIRKERVSEFVCHD